MLKHYFKIAIRSIIKSKIVSIISIISFAVGLTSALLILLYVVNETSYDRYNKNRKYIYRILTEIVDNWEEPRTQYILAPTLKSNYPEIINITRINNLFADVKKGEEYITNVQLRSADNDIFKIFTLPFLKGDPESALMDPFSVVISESMSREYFVDQDALGKSLTVKIWGEEIQLTVSGVMKNIPENSTFKADFIVPTDLSVKYWSQRFDYNGSMDDWMAPFYGETYLLLPENYGPAELENKFAEFEKTYLPEVLREIMRFHLQPLMDVYLRSSHLVNNSGIIGNIKNVYIFSLVGFIILIIASINYSILTAARLSTRSKEIGIRKVLGAGKNTLVKQILGESVITSFISLPFALLLAHLLLPAVNQLLRKQLVIHYTENWQYIAGFLLLTLFVGILSGSYLAFYISSFRPVDVLKSKVNNFITRSVYQKVLIITQLIIFIILILGTSVIYKQIHYALHQDMGLNKEGLVMIHFDNDDFRKRYGSFKNELSKNPDILNVSGAMFSPPYNGGMYWDIPRTDEPDQVLKVEGLSVDFNYIETLGFKLIDGRTFSEKFASDSTAIMLNETAVKKLGLVNPVGEMIDKKTVIGVIKDFHLHSFHMEINPMVIFMLDLKYAGEVVIRINPDNIPATLDFIENKWKEFAPDVLFDYSFFDDLLKELYSEERRFGQMISLITLLAIFISSIGLLGLALFIGEQRVKEIGIRKVFSSSVSLIVKLILKEYIWMVLIANVVAWPVAYYLMNKWLQNFVYHTKINFWLYILAAVLSIFIVLITISFQTIKAAQTNPAETLKYE
jgi:putative ABC transport system permease protein